MTKNKNILIGAIALMLLSCFRVSGNEENLPPNDRSRIQLTTVPPVAKILPFEAEATTPQSPVSFNIQAIDALGQPLKNAKIHLTVFTPPKNTWFPTDFPVVEGTKLLDIETIAPSGKVQVQQILPIRGEYQLLVNVSPDLDRSSGDRFTPIRQTLTLSIPENPVKWRNFAILTAILLLAGVGGGWTIGGSQKTQPGEIAPERVRLLLSGVTVVAIAVLLIVNISAEFAESHSHKDHHSDRDSLDRENRSLVNSNGIKLELTGDSHATVGQLANFILKAIDAKTGKPVANLALKIKTVPVEDDRVAFAYNGTTDKTGKFQWHQQFFDGTPHRVEVEVSPKIKGGRDTNPTTSSTFSSLRVEKAIDVEGVAPPLSARLIPLAYFTSTIALGLGLGLRMKHHLAK